MMTRQEIFYHVQRKLLQQGRRSTDANAGVHEGTSCVYRNIDGLKCAVGHLIPDDKYRSSFENTNFCEPMLAEALKSGGVDINDKETRQLLRALQRVHDRVLPESWHGAFNAIEAFVENDDGLL